MNSPLKIYIRINNLNKIEIEDDNVTVSGPLTVNSFNVGTSLTNHGTPISTIQGNISTINTDVSNLHNNIQNNITLLGGTNITVTESPTDTFTIDSSAGSNSLGTYNISVYKNSIDLQFSISTDNCSLTTLSVDSFMNVSVFKNRGNRRFSRYCSTKPFSSNFRRTDFNKFQYNFNKGCQRYGNMGGFRCIK